MTNAIGLREARIELGDIANRADLTGEITYLTRNGKRIAAVVPIHIAQEHTVLNVISTNAHVDVDEEYAEQVDVFLESAIPDRQTYIRNSDGQKDYYVHVVTHDLRDGSGTTWLVDYFDPASREVEEYESEKAAEARYEELVRASANDLGEDTDGNQRKFTETDVPGVPGYDA